MDGLSNDLLTHWYRLALAMLEGEKDIAADAQDDVILCVQDFMCDIEHAFERLARAQEEGDSEWVADALEDIHILLQGVDR